ncbi:MAG: efflux RND transporter permease subunit [Chitinophagia bacterium]|nr:efflux RND transporter permease subunit [Chitinophagia bacterium]
MSTLNNIKEKFKEFKPTSWSITNKTSIYLLMLFISLGGIYQFLTLPKEQFPEIVIPTMYVQTVYVGNSPKDIENLVTRPIEKQIKAITGVKINKFTSVSQQDFSAITVEFNTSVKPDIALQKVKDAVDKAKNDLPNDLTQEPRVIEVNFSEQPIMYVNISGNYSSVQLKKYADDLKDKLENITQVNRVDLVGAPEREFQINVDNFRMQSSGITFDDITYAIQRENLDLSGGLLEVGTMQRNLQLKGQLKNANDIANIIVRNTNGAPIYLRDVATIVDTVKKNESYARLDGKNVLTLNIIKRSGENLIETSDAVKKIVDEAKLTFLPKDLKTVITGDQSIPTRSSFTELVNSIVIGFVLVLIVLMFFMGVTNAFFVALSVPLSMFVAFVFLPAGNLLIGTNITLNFMVLFALLFGLGIIVDDAIVVIENTHRIFVQGKGKLTATTSAKMAAGEVFIPVLAGTITTLAPFFPLLFWPGIIGKFMVYLPAMLIFTLTASLVVAFIMNPVFAVDFMNHEDEKSNEPKSAIFKKKNFWIPIGFGIVLDIMGATFLGNLTIFFMLLVVANKYFIASAIKHFQETTLPNMMDLYERILRRSLTGWRPVKLLFATFGLLILSFVLFGISVGTGRTGIEFFPQADPNEIYVYLKLPVGSEVKHTDSITKVLEARVNKVLGTENGKKNPVVESTIANIAVGASDPMSGDRSTRSELGRIHRKEMKGIPGAEITVTQESNGPPTEPPVNIEIQGDDFDKLIKTAVGLKNYLDAAQIPGIEELKMDVDLQNPELTLTIDRERALIEGVSSAQVGMQIRTALFGKEISKIKDGKDEYKIQLRNQEMQRKNLVDLLNMRLSFRDMAAGGMVKNIPISSLVKVEPTSTLGSVKRKNQKRQIQLRSNVLSNEGYNPTAVNAVIAQYIENYKGIAEGVTVQQTGENEQQLETVAFLGKALIIALMLILFTLVLQFNSISKSVIILTEILFSIIGVLLGFALTGMKVSGIMTGLGIVGLAGIVVKNGILVIEFADELRSRGYKTREAVVQAGKTRIIPVLLTALAAILGFIPIAVGFNINFVTLFSELNPHIFFGGDNVAFWKPLSWTIIFGLAFAFFMTLFIVPAMYLIAERLRRPMRRQFGGKWISMLGIPPLTFIFIPLMFVSTWIHNKQVKRRTAKNNANGDTVFNGSWF